MSTKNNARRITEAEELFRQMDDKTAQAVDNGLLLQKISGTDRAAAYLKSYGVCMDVAMRVLSRHNARRR